MRSREAGRASLSTAVLRSLSVSALPALFCPVEGYKERNRRHEIKTEHESDGGSRGTRAAEPDHGLVQTQDTIISRLDTELRRCAHWILPTKECRDRGERGGLCRAGRGFVVSMSEKRRGGCSSFP